MMKSKTVKFEDIFQATLQMSYRGTLVATWKGIK